MNAHASSPNSDGRPQTVAAAVGCLLAEMSAADRQALRDLAASELLLFQHGWAGEIIARFGLDDGNEALLAACAAQAGTDPFAMRIHPDCAAAVLIRAAWRTLREG